MTYDDLNEQLPSFGHRPSLTASVVSSLTQYADERIRGDFWGLLPAKGSDSDELPVSDALYMAAALVELRRYEADEAGMTRQEAGYQRQLMSARSTYFATSDGRAPQVDPYKDLKDEEDGS